MAHSHLETSSTSSSSSPSLPSSPSSPSSSSDEDYSFSRTHFRGAFYEKKSKGKGMASNKSAHKLRDIVILLKDNNPFAASRYKRIPRPDDKRTRRPLTNDLLAFCRAMVKEGLLEFQTALEIYPNYEAKLRGVPEMEFNSQSDEAILSPSCKRRKVSRKKPEPSPPQTPTNTETIDDTTTTFSPQTQTQSQTDFMEDLQPLPEENPDILPEVNFLSNWDWVSISLLAYTDSDAKEESRALQQTTTLNFSNLEYRVETL